MKISILLDGRDVGVGPQELQVRIGEASSESLDNVPFVRNRRAAADFVGKGGGTDNTINVVLESHNVTSGDRVLGSPDQDGGREDSESREDTENDGDQPL